MVSARAVLGFFLRCGYGELEQHLSKTLCALNMSSKIRLLPWIFSESLNEYASSKECPLPHCATSLLGTADAADHPTQMSLSSSRFSFVDTAATQSSAVACLQRSWSQQLTTLSLAHCYRGLRMTSSSPSRWTANISSVSSLNAASMTRRYFRRGTTSTRAATSIFRARALSTWAR